MKHIDNNEIDDKDFDDQLMAAAKALGTDVKPGRDLWPGVAEGIFQAEAKRQSRSLWNSVWAQAAAVLLLVGGSSGITYLVLNEQPPATTVAGGPALVFAPVSGSFGSQYHLGPDYIDAQRNLAGRLEDELGRLDPEVREAVLTNINSIRAAIAEINVLLAQDPDNVLLQELLLSSYRDELALMKKVDGITQSAMRRGDI